MRAVNNCQCGAMPKKPPNIIVQQLKSDFAVVADHFGMPEKDRKVALDSALASPSRSAACYRAIAKSLTGISAQSSIEQRR